ncbi:MAG: hydrogenase expression/formation protein [Burkholderiales bacterium]|jgi:hydrogenase-1 operon protein HyaF|nr:hydrogenase expression/formation protein [Burkholderiales bacterium]
MNKPFPIPVRAITDSPPIPADNAAVREAGHSDDELSRVLELPRTANAFLMPSVPHDATPETLKAAADVLDTFYRWVKAWTFSRYAREVPRLDILPLPDDIKKVLNEVLGEGEVSARVEFKDHALPEWRNVYVQESVFPGLWRVREFNHEGTEIAHWVEASSLPQALIDQAQHAARGDVPDLPMPEGVMNAPSLLNEIRAALANVTENTASRAINLTLLPLSPADYDALLAALPMGVTAIVSRGFGSCRVTSTGVKNVWRVRHFNQKDALILNAIEVVFCPHVVLAAQEDIDDTKERLADLISWMRECAQNPL